MALLRHLCFPSTTSFLTAQPLQKPLHSILSFSSSFSPLSHALPLRTTRRINLFHVSASAQTQSPPPASPSTAVTVDTPQNDEEEEFSRTRLIAQNIPWTCTAQDIRSLFEKYGTVLDVEVLFFFTFKLVLVSTPTPLFFPPFLFTDLGIGIVLFSCVC